MNWYNNPQELAEFLEWMIEKDGYDLKACLGILRKPWHWETEYQEMRTAFTKDTTRRAI